jgi:hypothetical protein
MKIGKWVIELRLPWVIKKIPEYQMADYYKIYGQFCQILSSDAIPAGTAVMVAPNGLVSPRIEPNEILGWAISDSTLDAHGKHTVLIRLGGVSE